MDWNDEAIKNSAFTHYELDNESQNLSGYHVNLRNAFEGYKEMDDATKLVYIMQMNKLSGEGILDEEEKLFSNKR